MTDTATTDTQTVLDPNAIGSDFDGETEQDEPTDEEQ
jgi:hypothetical protein